MKQIIYSFLLFLPLSYCNAQCDVNIKARKDSFALISRSKADNVLSHFDTIVSSKIIYSLLNRDYYVIIQSDKGNREFFILLDSLNNLSICKEVFYNNKEKYDKIKGRKNRKRAKQIDEDEKSAMEKAFNLSNYHKDFITSVPDAIRSEGVPSYFVVKDKDGNRYGEYYLASITWPAPIDSILLQYISKKIFEETKLYRKNALYKHSNISSLKCNNSKK